MITGSLGEVQESRKYVEKAVEIGKKINSPFILTLAFSLRGLRFHHFGIPDEEGLEYCQNILPMLKQLQNARASVFVYMLLAVPQACKGDYLGSISTFQEGLKFAEETGEALNRAKLLNFIGWVYSDLGWISEAKKLNEQSYEAALEIGYGSEEAEANAVVNLAENAVAEGDYEQAEKYIWNISKKAETDPGYLINKHRWEVRLLCTLGDIYLHKDELEEAMKCAQQAFDIAEKTLNIRGKVKVNRLMGEIYLGKKDFSNAEEKLNQALALAKEAGNPPQLWRTYFSLGQLNETNGLDREAKEKYSEAIKVIEKVSLNLEDEKIRGIFLNSDQAIKIKNALKRLE